MFFIGIFEIILIIFCAIIFIKPEDIPKIIAHTGQLLAKIRRAQNLIKAEVSDVSKNLNIDQDHLYQNLVQNNNPPSSNNKTPPASKNNKQSTK